MFKKPHQIGRQKRWLSKPRDGGPVWAAEWYRGGGWRDFPLATLYMKDEERAKGKDGEGGERKGEGRHRGGREKGGGIGARGAETKAEGERV